MKTPEHKETPFIQAWVRDVKMFLRMVHNYDNTSSFALPIWDNKRKLEHFSHRADELLSVYEKEQQTAKAEEGER